MWEARLTRLVTLPGARQASEHVQRLFGASYAGVLSAVYMSTFLVRVSFGIVVVTFSAYVDDLSNFQYGLLVAANPLFELLAIVGIGLVIDRYGRRGVLLTGLALGAVSVLGLAATDHVIGLGALNALHGVAAAAILVPTLTILADSAPQKTRGREMGGFNFVQLFGWFSGFVLGFVLKEVFADDLRLTFIAAGGLAVLGFVYAFLVLREPDVRSSDDVHRAAPRDIAAAVVNRRVMSIAVPWLLVFLFVGSFLAFVGRASDGLELHGYATAVWMGFLAVLFLATQLVFGQLSDRYGRDVFMLVGGFGFLGLIASIALAFASVPDATPEALVPAIVRFAPALIVSAICALAFPPAALAALADVAREDLRGTTMSLYSLFISLGMILGPILVGLATDLGGHVGVIVFFGAVAAGLILSLAYRISFLGRDAFRPPAGDRPA